MDTHARQKSVARGVVSAQAQIGLGLEGDTRRKLEKNSEMRDLGEGEKRMKKEMKRGKTRERRRRER